QIVIIPGLNSRAVNSLRSTLQITIIPDLDSHVVNSLRDALCLYGKTLIQRSGFVFVPVRGTTMKKIICVENSLLQKKVLLMGSKTIHRWYIHPIPYEMTIKDFFVKLTTGALSFEYNIDTINPETIERVEISEIQDATTTQ
ncbi:24144_t:CDS:2, partial [Racocetra persica]